MNRPGDWNCRSCQHMNFQRRDCCQRCGESKFGVFAGRGRNIPASPGSDVRLGDWYCGVGNCGTHNFANRSSCFVCGAFKDETAAAAAAVGGFDFDLSARGSRTLGFGTNGNASRGGGFSWKSGDWICPRSGCNVHNFASRMECFRCNAPRDSF